MVTSTTYLVSYDGRDDTGPYAITFDVQLDSGGNAKDIKVYAVVKATGVKTDITATSTIAGLNVTTALTYDSTYDVILVRDPSATQPYKLPYGSKLPSKTIEDALDRLAFIAQKLQIQIDRSLRFPLTETVAGDLPTKAALLGKVIGLDAEGLLAAYAGVPTVPATAAAATVLDDETVSDMLTTLGLSAFVKTLVAAASASVAHRTLTSIKTVSSENYTVLDADGYTDIEVTTAASDRTITLPARSTNASRRLRIRKADSGAGKVIVAPAGTEEINGNNDNWEITEQYGYVELQENGAEWAVGAQEGSVYKATDTTERSQSNPTSGTWYNLGSLSLTLPAAGFYEITFCVVGHGSDTDGSQGRVLVTLSKANNTEDDKELTAKGASTDTGVTQANFDATVSRSKRLVVAAGTTYYLNSSVDSTGVAYLKNKNAEATAVISARRIA